MEGISTDAFQTTSCQWERLQVSVSSQTGMLVMWTLVQSAVKEPLAGRSKWYVVWSLQPESGGDRSPGVCVYPWAWLHQDRWIL